MKTKPKAPQWDGVTWPRFDVSQNTWLCYGCWNQNHDQCTGNNGGTCGCYCRDLKAEAKAVREKRRGERQRRKDDKVPADDRQVLMPMDDAIEITRGG